MILGIDPSLNNFAMVLFDGKVVDQKLIRSKPDVKGDYGDYLRARQILTELNGFVKRADKVFAESSTGSQRARSAKTAGICIGLLSTIENLQFVTPYTVKKVVKPKASKEEMIAWARDKHPELKWAGYNYDEHYADALAVIYAGLWTIT